MRKSNSVVALKLQKTVHCKEGGKLRFLTSQASWHLLLTVLPGGCYLPFTNGMVGFRVIVAATKERRQGLNSGLLLRKPAPSSGLV